MINVYLSLPTTDSTYCIKPYIHALLGWCAPLWSYLRIHPLHLLGSVDPSLLLKLLSLPHQPGLKRQLVLLPLLVLFLAFPLLCLAWETRVIKTVI